MPTGIIHLNGKLTAELLGENDPLDAMRAVLIRKEQHHRLNVLHIIDGKSVPQAPHEAHRQRKFPERHALLSVADSNKKTKAEM